MLCYVYDKFVFEQTSKNLDTSDVRWVTPVSVPAETAAFLRYLNSPPVAYIYLLAEIEHYRRVKEKKLHSWIKLGETDHSVKG